MPIYCRSRITQCMMRFRSALCLAIACALCCATASAADLRTTRAMTDLGPKPRRSIFSDVSLSQRYEEARSAAPALTSFHKQPPNIAPGIEEPLAQEAEAMQPEAVAPGEEKKEQTYGQKPQTDTMQFLRQQSVLLTPGSCQLDLGFDYALFENNLPQLVTDSNTGAITGVVNVKQRTRLLFVPLAVRYGLTSNIQLFGYMPVGYSNNQTSATQINFGEVHSTGGQGDVTAGANINLCEGCGYRPAAIWNVYFTAPSGNFNSPLFGLVPGSALGQGFWAVGSDVLFINRYDPIVCYWGGGYRHLFARNFENVLFQPGEQFFYQFGVGFAVNDRVTLSTTLLGNYLTEIRVNNMVAQGSNLDPISLRFAITIARQRRIIEPFALIGATTSAPQAWIGVTYTFR